MRDWIAHIERQVAAAMRREDLNARKPVERTAKDQLGQTNGRLKRLTNGVHQIMICQPCVQRGTPGMNENDCTEFVRLLPEWIEETVGNVPAIDQGRYLYSFESTLADQAIKLSSREQRVLQRNSPSPMNRSG